MAAEIVPEPTRVNNPSNLNSYKFMKTVKYILAIKFKRPVNFHHGINPIEIPDGSIVVFKYIVPNIRANLEKVLIFKDLETITDTKETIVFNTRLIRLLLSLFPNDSV